MGATRGAILRVFILTGVAIGATGTALGVALGTPIALNLENIREFVNRVFSLNLFPGAILFPVASAFGGLAGCR